VIDVLPISPYATATPISLEPEPIDLWHAWLFAEAEASLALATWNRAPDGDKARAYTTYAAALDREEQAGRVLAIRVDALLGSAANSG
jgi:hypothetical protein